jgi:hypothetical protein
MSNKEEGKGKSGEDAVKEAEQSQERKEIERIKSDVDRMSQELKTAIADLKKSIVDIRSAVSEIENPFNLLRVISSEEDLKKISGKLSAGVKSVILEKPEGERGEAEAKLPVSAVEAVKPSPEPAPIEEHKLAKPSLKPSGASYLDWVWFLLDAGLTADDVSQMARSYELLGFLPKGVSEQLQSLAIAAEKVRSRGFTKGMFLLNMYEASIISGKHLEAEDLKALISFVGKLLKEVDLAKRVE